MSSRGLRAASKKNTAAKFSELRALKASGNKRIDTYKVNQDEDIYEEVDEAGYKKVVRDRLDRDDFVVDDNGLGYADNGMDDFDKQSDDEDSDGGRYDQRKRGSRKSRSTGKKVEETVQADKISKYLRKDPIAAAPAKTVCTRMH